MSVLSCLSCLSVTLVYCGQTVVRIKMKLDVDVDLGQDHIVLGGDQAPSPKRGTDPQLSAHAYCGQTAGRTKTPLGTEVDLGRGHIVLHGDATPPPRRNGHSSTRLFSAHVYCDPERPSQLLLRSCNDPDNQLPKFHPLPS